MAITLDTTSSGTDAGSVELTVAHECTGTDTDGILVVVVVVTDSGIDDRTISTVTHNGEALTNIPSATSDAYSEERVEIWYRLNPTAGGSPNIVVTPGGSCTDLSLGAISLTDVGSAPAFVTQTASGDETPPTLDITTAGTDSWVIDGVASQEPGGKLVPAHNTILDLDVGGDQHCAQYVDAGGAGSQTMNYTDPDSDTHWAMSAVSVQFQNSPTVALGSPAHEATGVSVTPGLTFTGTDDESDEIEYNVQVDTVNTFDSQPSFIDSYSETNRSSGISMDNETTGDTTLFSQSFTGDGNIITSANLYLQKGSDTPTGDVYVKIYSHSGVYGTSSLPDTLLATSDAVDVSTISATYSLTNFTFSGGEQITLEEGTYYCLVYDVNSTAEDGEGTSLGTDNTSPSHDGSTARYTENGGWTTVNYGPLVDACFNIPGGTEPLLNKLSVTPDATFSGTGDPHPWPSGNEITYQVQAGDTLDVSTIYYWRVRGADVVTTIYGAWSPGDSTLGYDQFTTAGAGGTVRRYFAPGIWRAV